MISILIDYTRRTARFFKRYSTAQAFLVFSFFFIIFLITYFYIPIVSSGDDHYFHFRFAQMLRENGFFSYFRHFDAIYFSKISSGSYLVYYNFLFYLIILPFSYIMPLYLGIKLYAVFAITLTCVAIYLFLRSFGVRRPFLWTAFFIAVSGSILLWRFFLSRPFTLAPIILLGVLASCSKKRYVWAAMLSFAYLFWHGPTFFFPLAIGFTYWFFEYFYHRHYDWRSMVAIVVGIGAAIGVCYAIAPGFFLYVKDTTLGIFSDTLVGKSVSLPEGGEVYPMNLFDFINNNLFLFSLFIISICVHIGTIISTWPSRARILTSQVSDRIVITTALFFINIAFLAGTVLISRRFADFFSVFSWAFMGLVLSGLVSNLAITPKVRSSFLIGLFFAITYLFINNLVVLQQTFAVGSAPDRLNNIGDWLVTHTEKGDIVFNTDWGAFPLLYYHDPYNRYVTGLEPRFLYTYDQSLFWKWYHISTAGYICADQECPELESQFEKAVRDPNRNKQWIQAQGDVIAQTVIRDFKSHYIVTASNSSITHFLDGNAHFEKVLTGDNVFLLYQIYEKPQKVAS